MAVLVGLSGVQVPVASAILTTIAPDRYTVLDYRALESLGVQAPSPGVDFYLRYLTACRTLADHYGKTLRTLDRALWQWSKVRPRQASTR